MSLQTEREKGRKAEEARVKKSETSIFYEGNRAKLAGKPIYINPYMGEQGQVWFKGYRYDGKAVNANAHNGNSQRVYEDIAANRYSTVRDIANRLSMPKKIVNSAMCTLVKQKRVMKEGQIIDHKNRYINTYTVTEKETA